LDFYLVLLGGRTSGEWTGTPGLWVYFAVAAFFSGLAMTNWGAKWERRTFESTSWSLGEHIAWTAGSTLLFLASLSTLVSDELNPFIYFRF
jgi:cytochrome c oxidase assembly factor CtaG